MVGIEQEITATGPYTQTHPYSLMSKESGTCEAHNVHSLVPSGAFSERIPSWKQTSGRPAPSVYQVDTPSHSPYSLGSLYKCVHVCLSGQTLSSLWEASKTYLFLYLYCLQYKYMSITELLSHTNVKSENWLGSPPSQ